MRWPHGSAHVWIIEFKQNCKLWEHLQPYKEVLLCLFNEGEGFFFFFLDFCFCGVCHHNVFPLSFCVLAEPHVDSAQQLTWQSSAPWPRTRITWRTELCPTANYRQCSFPLTVLHWNFQLHHKKRCQSKKKEKQSKENKRRRGGRTKKKPLSRPTLLTIISEIKKKPTCLYIDFFMCCLTTAILQSYTVFADVQFKMFVQKKKRETEKREGGRERKKDSLHCQSDQMGLKEKQGATESIGSCRNWWVLSGRLFSSVPLLLRSTSLCILTWSIIIGWKKKARFTSVGWNLVCVFVLIWLPEDQLWTVVRLISTACTGVQTRGEKEKK